MVLIFRRRKKDKGYYSELLFDTPDDVPTDAILLDDVHYAVKLKTNKDKGQINLYGCMTFECIILVSIYVYIVMQIRVKNCNGQYDKAF